MPNIYVEETAAGRMISAWIILDKHGQEVAVVRAYHGNSRVLVNIYQRDNASARSLKAKGDSRHFQHSHARGYGYDKLTAALSGHWIDGHKLTDHCSREGAPKLPKGCETYPDGFKIPKGYHFANGRRDCYRLSGLDFLQDLGYHVLRAI
jgi:hypothetical protein